MLGPGRGRACPGQRPRGMLRWRRVDWFTGSSVIAAAVVVATAALFRGRFYAIFAAVLLSIHSAVASALWPFVGVAAPAFLYLHAGVYVHFLTLVRSRLRPLAYRALVSVPASAFWGGTFLAVPWALAVAFGFTPHGLFVPYVLAALGLVQSLRHPEEHVHLELDGRPVPTLARYPLGAARSARPLRIVQMSDPHLGPFMSERRLRALCERALSYEPDLVVLTGDFVTMESHDAGPALARALEPLAALEGRVFACLGNHDHEAPDMVKGALAAARVRLLVDEAARVETPAGPVQLVGFDFHFRQRKAKVEEVCRRFPREPGALRLLLLHDPGAFRHVPDGEGDLVLSGHTHGGQLGLLSLGLPHTFVSLFTAIPDHGHWALGQNRLYVHRGTAHYGFPLRIGVPAEHSLLHVHPRPADTGGSSR